MKVLFITSPFNHTWVYGDEVTFGKPLGDLRRRAGFSGHGTYWEGKGWPWKQTSALSSRVDFAVSLGPSRQLLLTHFLGAIFQGINFPELREN